MNLSRICLYVAALALVFCTLGAGNALAAPIITTGAVTTTSSDAQAFLFEVDGVWYKATSERVEREVRDARNNGRPVTVNGDTASGQNGGTQGNPHTANRVTQ